MRWLVDTNVLSELRKGARCNPNVAKWVGEIPQDALFTSVLVLGEIRRGIERLRRKDPKQAKRLSDWLHRVRNAFAGRILDVTEEIAAQWGMADAANPKPVIDGLLAATARVHELTLVTRNVADVTGTGVRVVNPFEE